MDGFDLGIGILFPFFSPGPERDSAMNSVAPVWDGNETWLVLGGGGLMAAFPLAYAIILPALYAPIIAMLLALIFRGVAFEFRWRDPGHRRYWDFAFTDGLDRRHAGAGHHARRPAPGHRGRGTRLCRRLVGLADAVQPAGRRQPRGRLCPARRDLADHEDRGRGPGPQLPPRRQARPSRLIVCIGLVSAATPFLSGAYYERWFAWPQVLFTAQVPLLVGLCSGTLLVSLRGAGSTGRSC